MTSDVEQEQQGPNTSSVSRDDSDVASTSSETDSQTITQCNTASVGPRSVKYISVQNDESATGENEVKPKSELYEYIDIKEISGRIDAKLQQGCSDKVPPGLPGEEVGPLAVMDKGTKHQSETSSTSSNSEPLTLLKDKLQIPVEQSGNNGSSTFSFSDSYLIYSQ